MTCRPCFMQQNKESCDTFWVDYFQCSFYTPAGVLDPTTRYSSASRKYKCVVHIIILSSVSLLLWVIISGKSIDVINILLLAIIIELKKKYPGVWKENLTWPMIQVELCQRNGLTRWYIRLVSFKRFIYVNSIQSLWRVLPFYIWNPIVIVFFVYSTN